MDTSKQHFSLLFINPGRKFRYHWDLQEVGKIMGKKIVYHPLALPLLAALTPPHYRIKIIDEEMESLPYQYKPDLVGITAFISNIRRAYEIAQFYRKRDIPVIMGGPQVSINIEESLKYADSIVVGEAENIWKDVLKDFERNDLQKKYKAQTFCSFKKSPIPRWDLLDTSKIMSFQVQASRGCPYSCDFCLVRKLYGARQRYRDIDNVIKEIEALPKGSFISFADDNLTANKQYTKRLMERLIPLEVSWGCQASVEITNDIELLHLMAKAGCMSILIGYETLNPQGLIEANKSQNKITQYKRGIENTHGTGIHIIGSFVAGFDSDTISTFDEIFRFTQENNLSFVMLNALAAYRGTDLYHRMKKTGRVTKVNSDLCNGIYPTMLYKNISQVDMFCQIVDTLERIYSYKNLCKKAEAVFKNGNFSNSFSRTNPLKISFLSKIRSIFFILTHYILTFHKYKRRLFFLLFSLLQNRKADMETIMQYLLFTSSFHGYLKFINKQKKNILPELKEKDKNIQKIFSSKRVFKVAL